MLYNTPEEVKSPCIGVCAIDDLTGFCQGCYRNIDEIKGWWDMHQDAQKSLLIAIENRQLQLTNFDN